MAKETIRNATTIATLITAVNDHYATTYRDLFPDNSPLNAIWDTHISVEDGTEEQTAFLAEGELMTFPFTFADQVENPTFTIKAKLEIIEASDTA